MTGAPNVYDAEPIPPSAMQDVEDLLRSGDLFRYTSDEAPVTRLELRFAEMIGAEYALAVASCSAALFLSLKALDLPIDAKVLIPAFTFAAVPSAVVHAGCRPVLVEVGPDYRLDMDDFAANFTDDIDAVLISHMRGHTSDMTRIMAMASDRNVPVVEDAAHSLGTKWNGQNIGTLGEIGCFSFQSYKMLNAGEGGILVTNNPDLLARATIMSGAYEHNWRKHAVVGPNFSKWQNRLPLYNTRLNNLSAALVLAQLPTLGRRVDHGLRNHNYVAEKLNGSPWLVVPDPLSAERRAPDSIQFNLLDFSDAEVEAFVAASHELGVSVQVFGMAKDNARAFWNWDFLEDIPELPRTRQMLMRACDMRLPARLGFDDLDYIANAILGSVDVVKAQKAYGT